MATLNEILTRLGQSFEDPIGVARPLWRDYSRYQLYVDYDVAKAKGILGVYCRAGISWGYIDPFYNYNWEGAGRVGMYRSSYHVLYPSQSIVAQADKVWYKAQPEIEVIPRVIDLEVHGNQSWSRIGDATWAMSELVKSRDGVRPLIYSRSNLIESWLMHWTPAMLAEHFFILAQYRYYRWIEHRGPPTLPKYKHVGSAGPLGTEMVKREQVVMQQTADKKAPFSGELPTRGASKSVDWDRWELGNEEEMHQWIATAWGDGTTSPPDETVPPVDIQERVKVTAVPHLNIREKPTSSSTDLGELITGSVVPVVESEGPWKKITGWIHGDYTKIV